METKLQSELSNFISDEKQKRAKMCTTKAKKLKD